MNRTALIATLLWASSSVAQTLSPAAPPAPDQGALLPALASCGDWYAERRGEAKYQWQSDVFWFQGFVSAHNLYVRLPANAMITAEPNDVALWLDTYCQKNPTNNLAQGAMEYIAVHGGRSAVKQGR